MNLNGGLSEMPFSVALEVRPKDLQASWLRCREIGLNPGVENYPTALTGMEIESRLASKRALIEVVSKTAQATLNDLKGVEVGWGLVDQQGAVLDIGSNSEDLGQILLSNNVVIGAVLSEDSIGTGAPSLSLVTGVGQIVSGKEHYSNNFQCFNCLALPIRDPSGRAIACLNFATHSHVSDLHKINAFLRFLLSQAVLRIEEEFWFHEKLKTVSQFIRMPAVLSELSSNGVLLTGTRGEVLFCNDLAEAALNLNRLEMIGADIRAIFPNEELHRKIVSGRECTEKVSFEGRQGRESIALRLSPMPGPDGAPRGSIIVMQPDRKLWGTQRDLSGHAAKYTFQDLVGTSRAMRAVLRRARIASQHAFPVLLEGETGSGKELLAQAIHNAGPRRGRPFVAINCAAIPRELVESELFGYAGGAFTGSKKEGSRGKLQISDGGTILLDEVNTLPLEAQGKLLRALESRQIVRVGDVKAHDLDLRIIACTSANLEREIERGTFRRDLFYRINVFKIELPPLRARREDISLLTEAILHDLFLRGEVSEKKVDPEVLSILMAHDWPGNVRELRNCLEHAAAVSEGESILPDDLPEYLLHGVPGLTGAQENGQKPFDAMEKGVLQRALAQSGGSVEEAAKMLEISRSAFYRKLKKHGLVKKDLLNAVSHKWDRVSQD